ncbi:hypothetical protein JW905_03900 [bacterium]|nr:hypothetical protein [candidate division CSSED10-310 bacterium]
MNSMDIIVLGLEPLSCLTPMDGIPRSLALSSAVSLRYIGVATGLRHSGLILDAMFHETVLLEAEGESLMTALIERFGNGRPAVLLATRETDLPHLARYATRLKTAGIHYLGPDITGLEQLADVTLERLRRMDIPVVDWSAFRRPDEWPPAANDDEEPLAGVLESADTLEFPVLLTSLPRAKTWIVENDWDLETLVKRLFNESEPVAMVRPYDEEEAFQVAVVTAGNGEEIAMAIVREIARDDLDEAWIFMSIEDRRLAAAARLVTTGLSPRGPCTLRFLYDARRGFLLDRIIPLLPVWCHLPATAGINLPWLLVAASAGIPVNSSPTLSVAGKILVFNAFDIPVAAERWLRVAGEGGFSI